MDLDVHIEGIKDLYIDDALKTLSEFALENGATVMSWRRDGGGIGVTIKGQAERDEQNS